MSARVADIAGLPGWPKLLSADQAAKYLGVSRDTFLSMVERKIMPAATDLQIRRKLWNRDAIDLALSKRSPAPNDWRERREAWRKRQDRSAGTR